MCLWWIIQPFYFKLIPERGIVLGYRSDKSNQGHQSLLLTVLWTEPSSVLASCAESFARLNSCKKSQVEK